MLIRQSEAARQLGVHRITLRRWEQRGLIQPVSTPRPGKWYASEQVDYLRQGNCRLVPESIPTKATP
jgi:DNA-binding transcriptional MerR regulator